MARYAKHRGVQPRAVNAAIREGRILLQPDGSIDPEVADQQWEANTSTIRRPHTGPGRPGGKRPGAGRPRLPLNPTEPASRLGNITRAEAERLGSIAKAERAQLDVERLRGDLLDRALVLRTVEAWARAWREELLALPSAEAEHLAAELEAEPRKAAIALERIIHKHLEARARATFRLADQEPPD